MSDERLNQTPETEGDNKVANEAAPEVFEAFLEEQAQGTDTVQDKPEAEQVTESVEEPKPEDFAQSAPTQDNPTYAWSSAAQQPEVNQAENCPPMWENSTAQSGGARINMQVKKKKK